MKHFMFEIVCGSIIYLACTVTYYQPEYVCFSSNPIPPSVFAMVLLPALWITRTLAAFCLIASVSIYAPLYIASILIATIISPIDNVTQIQSLGEYPRISYCAMWSLPGSDFLECVDVKGAENITYYTKIAESLQCGYGMEHLDPLLHKYYKIVSKIILLFKQIDMVESVTFVRDYCDHLDELQITRDLIKNTPICDSIHS